MELTNLETVPGRTIVRHLGLVQGSTVRSKHVGRDFLAGLKNFVGLYRPLTTTWTVLDNSEGGQPHVLAAGEGIKTGFVSDQRSWLAFEEGANRVD